MANAPTVKSRKRMFLVLAAVFAFISIIVAGLWPFRFNPSNGARLLSDENGIGFRGRSIAYTNDLSIGSVLLGDGKISIEAVLEAEKEPGNYMADIISINDGGNKWVLRLSQWRSHVFLRFRQPGTGRVTELAVRHALEKGKKKFLAVTSGPDGTAVYIDGKAVKRVPSFRLSGLSAVSGFTLSNSPEGNNGWQGKVYSLAFFSVPLKDKEIFADYANLKNKGPELKPVREPKLLYNFKERSGTLSKNSIGDRNPIMVPPVFQAVKKNILSSPLDDSWQHSFDIPDAVINFLGFIPFGAALSALCRRRHPLRLWLPFLTGALISLGIELAQVNLPGRYSSLTDFIFNSTGSLAGAWLFLFFSRFYPGRP